MRNLYIVEKKWQKYQYQLAFKNKIEMILEFWNSCRVPIHPTHSLPMLASYVTREQ